MSHKSSDGEKKDGSLIETEPMETSTSTGVASSLLGKRKAENSSPGEGEDNIEVVDGDEEDDSDPNWDKDSFDGLVYHPSDDSEYSDEELQEQARHYNRRVIETKGFFEVSDKFPKYLWTGIVSISEQELESKFKGGITVREFIGNMASQCVEKFNRRNKKNVKLERTLRANYNPGGRTKYYITFAARESDSPDAPLVEYQAKVISSAGKVYPILCRPSPPPEPCTCSPFFLVYFPQLISFFSSTVYRVHHVHASVTLCKTRKENQSLKKPHFT